MTKLRILLLDDEPEILKSLTRVLRKHYEVESFTQGQDALDAMQEKLFPLIISDMRMPEMDGATFLSKAHQLNPISQKILLTGYSDPEDTSKAVNHGNIDFYINKPWDNDELLEKLSICAKKFEQEYKRRAITKQVKNKNQQLQSSIKQSQQALEDAEHKKEQSLQKLKSYYQQFIEMLSQCIQMHGQDEFAHGERIATQVKYLCLKFKGTPLLAYQSSIAARLYELGKMQLPQELLLKHDNELKLEEKRQLMQASELTASMLSQFAEFSVIAKITRHVHEHFDGSGLPNGMQAEEIPPPCQWILVTSLYDKLITGKVTGEAMQVSEAIQQLQQDYQGFISPLIMKSFLDMLKALPSTTELPIEFALNASQLKAGMKLARDLPLESAKSNFLNQGHILTNDNISSLKTIEQNKEQPLIIFVFPHHHQQQT